MVCRRRVSLCCSAATLLALAALAPLPAQAAVTTYTGTFAGPIAAGDTALLNDGASVSGNVANSGTLQFNMSGSSAVANNAIISGTGLVRMTGSGTVTNLFDAQTYTGATRLENGTLLVNYNDRLGNTSSGVTFDGGRLQITNSGVVSTFSTARSMSLVSAGTIDTSTLANGSYDQPAFTGPVSGTGTLTLAAHGLGSGASDAYLRLGGASTYTGTTRIISGMVYASSTSAFGTSTVVLDGGGLVAPAAVTVNNALVLAGTANFVRPWSSQTVNLGGSISGTGGLQKTDNGTVNLNAANSYNGDTRILAGTLNAANYAALAGTTLDMNAADTGSIGFTVAQTGTYQIGGLTGSRNLANGGNGFAIGANGASTTYSGTLSGGGRLVKAGGGTLTLTGSNSYTGGTSLEGGALELGSAGAIGSFGTISFTGGTLRYSANNATDYSSRFSTAAGQQYSIDTNGRTVDVNVGLTSAGGSLTKLGEGTLNLLSGLNSYSGTTTIASGTLAVSTGVLGPGPVVNNGALAFEVRGLQVSNRNTISGTGRLLKKETIELILHGSNSYSGGTTVEDGALLLYNNSALGSGTLELTAASSRISILGSLPDYRIWNPVTIGGNVVLGQSAALPSPVFAGPVDLGGGVRTLVADSPAPAVTGTISNGGLRKTGNGTLYLLGGNSYAGATTVIQGGLALINAGDVSASSGLALFATGQFSIAGADGNRSLAMLTGPSGIVTLGARTLTVGNSTSGTFAGNINGTGGLTKAGSGALTLSGSNSFTGQTTVSAGTLILNSGNALAPTAAAVVNSGATLQADQPIRIGYLDSAGTVVGGGNLTATLTVTRSGTIGGITNGTDGQGTFAAGIAKLGTGTSTVNASNTYTGLTWVREGTLAMGVSNAFAAASDLTVDSGATFDRAGFSQTVTNAVVNGGVGNSSAGGLLTVTGTLSGSGSVNGATLVNGVHAPGNAPGIQTFNGDLTYSAGAAVNWELVANTTGSAGTVSDQIALPTGNLAFSGSTAMNLSFNAAGSTVNWSDPFWAVDRAWLVYDLSVGTTTGIGNFSVTAADWLDANAATLSSVRPGSSFSVGLTGQDVILNYVAAVPEPGSLAVLFAGGAIGLGLRRRRAPIGRVSAILIALTALASSGLAQAAVTTYTGTFAGPIAPGDTALLNDGASVSGNVANSGTLQFNMSGSSAVANNAIISGTGLVRMTGSGTVSNLFDAQTYTGATRLENGTLLVNFNDRLGNTSSGVTFDGGRLQITNSGVNSTFSTARSMSLVSAGTIDTSTLANGSYDQPAFTGPISGAGTLTLAANGLGNGASDAYLRLGGTNTYTGTTRITSGMVYASSTSAFGTSTVVLDGGGLVAPAAVTANNALVLAGTANFVRAWTGDTMNLGGVISGTGGLQKTDNGTVNLSAANTYTGDTRIVAGTLNAGNYAALASTTLDMRAGDAGSIGFTVAQTGTYQIAGLTGSRAINNGGDTLAIGGNDASTTYAGNLSGSGGLIKDGAGTLTLSAGNSFTGDTRITAGTLAIENANGLQSSTLDMNSGDSGAITFSQASNIGGLTGSRGVDNGGYTLTIGGNDGNYTYAGTLSGTGGLIKNGSRSLGLTGSNSFRGDTRISAGTLVIANTNALANSTLDMNSGDSGVITFALASNIGGLKGSRAINNGGHALTIGGLVTSSTYSGALSGGGGLIKSGSGTLKLTGNNSYTGGTVLQGGTLALSDVPGVIYESELGSSGTISFTGGTLRYGFGGYPDLSARFSTAPDQLYAIDTNGTYVAYATPLTSVGGSLTKLGEGKLTLPDGDVGVVGVKNMSVLLVEGLLEGASGSSSLFIPGGQVLSVSGGVLGRESYYDAVTIDRIVIGSSDVPSQPIATGTISGGLVYVNGIEVGSSQSGTSAGGSLTVNGGFVKTKVSVGMASGTSASMLLTGGIVGDAESNHIVGVSGIGSLTMTGGSLVGGTASLGSAAGSHGSVVITGGTVSASQVFVGVSGTGVLDVRGGEVNTVLTAGQSSGSRGAVLVSGGVVGATITAGASFGSEGVVVISGGTVGGSGTSQNWDFRIGRGGIGSLTMTGGSLLGRFLNLGDDVGGAGAATISGGTMTVDTLTLGSAGSGEMTLTNGRVDSRQAVVARAGTFGSALRKGTLTVSGGTLTASESMSVGGFFASGTLSVADSGVVIVAGGTGTIDVGSIFGASAVNIGTGAAAGNLTVGQLNGNGSFGAGAAVNFNHTGTATFTPAMVGTMNVTKLGTGTTILTGSNTYAGLTWVREGTLVLGAANAFSEASTLTLDSGASFDRAGFSQTVTNAAINGSLANTGGGGLLTVTGTLSGSGVVNGNVSVAGIHAPGNSPGTQTFTSDLTYTAGAAVNWELIANTTGSAGTLSDQIVLPTGNLAFSGSTAMNLVFNTAGSTVNWSDPFWAVDRAWLVYDLSAGTTTGIGNFSVTAADWLDANAATLSSARPGSTFSVGLTGQDVILNYVAAVPEPASLAVLAAGAVIGLGLRLRRDRGSDTIASLQ